MPHSVSDSALVLRSPLKEAEVFYHCGRFTEAATRLRAALDAEPGTPRAWQLLGHCYAKTEQYAEALRAYQAWLKLEPDSADAHIFAARLHERIRNIRHAMAHYNQAIRLRHDHPVAYAELIFLLMEQNNLLLAEQTLNVAQRLCPDDTTLTLARIQLLRDMGRAEEARHLCETAFVAAPENDGLFCLLAEMQGFLPDDPVVLRMEGILARQGVNLPEAVKTAMALAEIHLRAGNIKTAFDYFARGNSWQSRFTPYREEARRTLFSQIKENFTHAGHPVAPEAAQPNPIFILGMPRSGTTLLEQALDCHNLIHGAGELTALGDLAHNVLPQYADTSFPRCIPADAASPEVYDRVAASYLSLLRTHSPRKPFVCDKMPSNFLYIGLIMRLFPNARILHCRRNAMDTCFSIYTHLFRGNHEYGNDLAALGRYYRMYDDLVRHWETTYPGRIHTVQYERLVEDFEPTMRGIFDYLGLQWDDACLRFYENKRQVKTLSRNQVNKPLYFSSVGRWKAYEKYLGPLKEALEDLAN